MARRRRCVLGGQPTGGPILWTREDGFQNSSARLAALRPISRTLARSSASRFHRSANRPSGSYGTQHRHEDLGTFRPSRINNRGQIVGYCPDPEATGTCIWEAGVFTHVNDGFGRGINERGQVVGGGAGATHGAAFFCFRFGGTVVLDDSEFGAAVDITAVARSPARSAAMPPA